MITLDVLKKETQEWKSAWSPRCVELLEWAAGVIERRNATYEKPGEGWICFHCGERFLTYDSAKEHFGETPDALAHCVALVDAMGKFAARFEGEPVVDDAMVPINRMDLEDVIFRVREGGMREDWRADVLMRLEFALTAREGEK